MKKLNYEDYIFAFETISDPFSCSEKETRNIIIFSFVFLFFLSLIIQVLLWLQTRMNIIVYAYIFYFVILFVILIYSVIFRNHFCKDIYLVKKPGQVMLTLSGILFFVDTAIILCKEYPDMFTLYIFSTLVFLILSSVIFAFFIHKKIYSLKNYKKVNYKQSLPLLVLFFQPITNYVLWRIDGIITDDIQLLIAVNIFAMIFLLGLPGIVLLWIFYKKFDTKNIYEVRRRKQDLLEKNDVT